MATDDGLGYTSEEWQYFITKGQFEFGLIEWDNMKDEERGFCGNCGIHQRHHFEQKYCPPFPKDDDPEQAILLADCEHLKHCCGACLTARWEAWAERQGFIARKQA